MVSLIISSSGGLLELVSVAHFLEALEGCIGRKKAVQDVVSNSGLHEWRGYVSCTEAIKKVT